MAKQTEKEIKKDLIIGLGALAVALGLFIYVFISGSFYSRAVFDRTDNALIVKGLLVTKNLGMLSGAQNFEMKADYALGSLCYNVEVTMVKNEKKMLFPFCVADSIKVKKIAKEANSFISKPTSRKKTISLFSQSNFIWFIAAVIAAVIGVIKIRKIMPKN